MTGKDQTSQKQENSEKSNKTKIDLIILASTTFFLIVVLILLVIHMGTPSDNASTFDGYSKSDLGTVGDFLGGLLNPFLTFITVLLLIRSLVIQQDELKHAIHELSQTTNTHKESLRNSQAVYIYENTKERFEAKLEEAKSIFNHSTANIRHTVAVGPGTVVDLSLRNIARLPSLIKDIGLSKSATRELERKIDLMCRATNILKDLRNYGKRYYDLGVDKILFESELVELLHLFNGAAKNLISLRDFINMNVDEEEQVQAIKLDSEITWTTELNEKFFAKYQASNQFNFSVKIS